MTDLALRPEEFRTLHAAYDVPRVRLTEFNYPTSASRMLERGLLVRVDDFFASTTDLGRQAWAAYPENRFIKKDQQQ